MLRKQADHIPKTSAFCGEIIEILSSKDCSFVDIAVVLDIKPTQAHYHQTFTEIYLVLDGNITLGLYDPKEHRVSEHILYEHELMVIFPGIHHKILGASEKNRICVISLPCFDPNDEHISHKF